MADGGQRRGVELEEGDAALSAEAPLSRRFSPNVPPGFDAKTLALDDGRRMLEPPPPELGAAEGADRWQEPLPGLPEHYHHLGEIGRGGSGEVHLVEDRRLGRTLALKVLQRQWAAGAHPAQRLAQEARLTAQLEHPGIAPVYDVGRLSDGRLFFTMKYVEGQELGDVIAALHEARRRGTSHPTLSLRRLVDIFRQLCQAVGFAHARGVTHGDLKPANIMVGAFGEVWVMDWGLARALGDEPRRPAGTASVVGTPAYMAPEQAAGELTRIGPQTDVYALGAVLYTLLSGRPPYVGPTGAAICEQVRRGPPAPLTRPNAPAAPSPLIAVCAAAMAREPGARPQSAGALAREVEAWLDGDRRAAQGLKVLSEAEALRPRIADLLADAQRRREKAEALKTGIPRWADAAEFAEVWALESEAEALESEADLLDVQYVQGLRGALTHDADLPEAHRRLAQHYRRRHKESEARGDMREAARYEVLLRAHDREGAYDAYLNGDGALSVATDPPGARVQIMSWALRGRRLHAEAGRGLGLTPLRGLPLARGSYVMLLSKKGCETVRAPCLIERGRGWDGIPPEGGPPRPIPLPPEGSLGGGAYVPPGWFIAGGDAQTRFSLPRQRVWVEAFVISRFPVTNAEYIAFLDDLVARREDAAARLHQPRERYLDSELGEAIYGRDAQGRFFLKPDAEGDVWLPNEPVTNIQWLSACAYARWRAARDGLPWRLPGELEWEKAARGVDGRRFPWGDHFHPSWACMAQSRPGRPLPSQVTEFPVDESPYGVRGMAGNVRDWCLERFKTGGPRVDDRGRYHVPVDQMDVARAETQRLLRGEVVRWRERVVRGGAWIETAPNLALSERFGDNSGRRSGHTGFRLVRSWPPLSGEGGRPIS